LQDRLIITRRGSRLSCLDENDLIETGIYKNDRCTPLASTELPVHRAIYQKTSASAIIHCHPPHAVALSLSENEIVPKCDEGLDMIGNVPVLIAGADAITPGILEDAISEALTEHRIVMVRGHGSFAIGQLLEEACSYTTMLEESSQVTCLLKSLGTAGN
jgi:L-fuculose-phosphate aldolase